jgi:hypothetical protein
MSLSDMRKELREMRKETVKPVSRMRKGDISAEIERLRNLRETTPPAAATPSAPVRKQDPSVEDVKSVKKKVVMLEKPGAAVKDGMKKPSAEKPKADMKSQPKMKDAAPSAKKLTKAVMMKMLSEMKD